MLLSGVALSGHGRCMSGMSGALFCFQPAKSRMRELARLSSITTAGISLHAWHTELYRPHCPLVSGDGQLQVQGEAHPWVTQEGQGRAAGGWLASGTCLSPRCGSEAQQAAGGVGCVRVSVLALPVSWRLSAPQGCPIHDLLYRSTVGALLLLPSMPYVSGCPEGSGKLPCRPLSW